MQLAADWTADRPVAQVVSPRLSVSAARVRAPGNSCGICGGRSSTGVGFLSALPFPLPLIAPHPSSCTIQHQYKRPVSGRSNSGLGCVGFLAYAAAQWVNGDVTARVPLRRRRRCAAESPAGQSFLITAVTRALWTGKSTLAVSRSPLQREHHLMNGLKALASILPMCNLCLVLCRT
jgi:hypothetical protein